MTSKSEIAQRLHAMIEERLFGAKPWPIDNNGAVHQQLLDWGLIKMQGDYIHKTELGVELDVGAWALFVGQHEAEGIPEILAYGGSITKQEADDLMSRHWDDGELEDLLPPSSAPPVSAAGRLS